MQEDLGLALRRMARLRSRRLGTDEDFALRQQDADERGESGHARCGPKEGPPTGRDFWDEEQVDDGGNEVSNGVALLQYAARETTRLNRKVLKTGRRGQAPDAAHGDTEERAQGEEFAEGLYEAGAEFENRDEEKVGDERPFASVTIRDNAEDDLIRGK